MVPQLAALPRQHRGVYLDAGPTCARPLLGKYTPLHPRTPISLLSHFQYTPLTSPLLSQDPKAPPTHEGTAVTEVTEEFSQVDATHLEPAPMGGRRSGVVATKPCSVQIKVSAVSTLLVLVLLNFKCNWDRSGLKPLQSLGVMFTYACRIWRPWPKQQV